jgi:hypothetical protein
MFEVTKDNYHTFLTWHGMDPEVAEYVVDTYDKSENYHKHLSVRLWVEASKYVIRINK